MMTCSIICEKKIKWWVRPMINLLKVWAVATRKTPDIDKLADLITRFGIKKKFTVKDV